MELHLQRTYYKEGTNGTLFYDQRFFGFTIELPCKENKRNISCIPEGIYEIKPRFTQKRKHHLIVEDVKNRSFILFHPANDAQRDLRGCIAPVTYLSGIGKGTSSRMLFNKLISLCYQAFDRGDTVQLIIKS